MTDHLISNLTFWTTVLGLIGSFFSSAIIVTWKISAINSTTKNFGERVNNLEKRLDGDIKDIREKIDKMYDHMITNS